MLELKQIVMNIINITFKSSSPSIFSDFPCQGEVLLERILCRPSWCSGVDEIEVSSQSRLHKRFELFPPNETSTDVSNRSITWGTTGGVVMLFIDTFVIRVLSKY